jgi:hypothetical protein
MHPAEWGELTKAHSRDVHEFFSKRGELNRLLKMDITAGDGYAKLCSFLEEPTLAGQFPRVDVFDLSWFIQPRWMIENALGRVTASGAVAAIAALALFSSWASKGT